MPLLRRFARLCRNLLRRSALERDLDAEVRSYVQMLADEKMKSGARPDAARREAIIELGGVEQVKEEVRDVRVGHFLDTVLQDVRHGLRMFAKNPGFTAVAVLTLALGIGVNTTIFSLVSAMLLRKPPVSDPDRLITLLSTNPTPDDEANRWPASAPDFLDWRRQATAYSGMAASSPDDFTLTGGTEPQRVAGAQVSANYFQVLGVEPVLGRAFLSGEDQAGHGRVVALREDLWKRRFGADPKVLGRQVKINGDDYTVIAVMPESFRKLWLFPAQLWIPLVFTPEQLGPAGRKQRLLNVFGRLKPGMTASGARAELATIARRIAAANPDSNQGWGGNVMTVQQYAVQESNSKTALLFLTAAVGFVLLIACANLANLLVARNSSRQREFAIRTALGAGRIRLTRQLLSECLMLTLLGGGLGLFFAVWGVAVLRSALNWNEYSVLTAETVSLDGPVRLFTLAISVAAALVSGLAPALRISQRDPGAGLKDSSRSLTVGREHRRLQSGLVIAELALSLILLVGASVFVAYFIEETHASRGMNPHNVLTASVTLSGAAYKDGARQCDFFENVLRQLHTSPEVQSAAVASDLPFTFPGSARFTVEGRPVAKPEEQPSAGYFAVSPGYFSVAQIPLREGREFTPADNAGSAPVAIVNQAFARKYFPDQDALGRRLRIRHENSEGTKWSEIVGVAGNVNEFLGQDAPRPQLFEPFLQRPDPSMNLVVRVGTEPTAFAESLRKAVWSVDKDQPVANLKTMDRVVQDAGQGDDLMTGLMSAFAALALLMAAVGIYGLIAYLVARRTHELGVRMALGARRGEVLMLVLRESMSLVLAGVGIGLAVSLGIPRLVTALFSGFHIRSGWILAGTPLAVILVALASCYFPARRASRVDPMVALRQE